MDRRSWISPRCSSLYAWTPFISPHCSSHVPQLFTQGYITLVGRSRGANHLADLSRPPECPAWIFFFFLTNFLLDLVQGFVIRKSWYDKALSSTPFLWTVVAVLVYVGSGKEHILALLMFNWTFYHISQQSCVCVWQIWWVFRGWSLDSSWLDNYITLLVLTSSYNLMIPWVSSASNSDLRTLKTFWIHWIPTFTLCFSPVVHVISVWAWSNQDHQTKTCPAHI